MRPMSSLARPAPLAAQAESSAGEIQRELTFVVLRPEVEGAGAVPAAPCRRLWCGSAAAGWGVAVLAWACLGLVWLGAAAWRRWWGHWEGAKRLRNINWKLNPRFVKARRAGGKQERYGGIESERPQVRRAQIIIIAIHQAAPNTIAAHCHHIPLNWACAGYKNNSLCFSA